ncbi:alpha/beta hydrolase [Anabaena sp. FACHB-1237]|nr:alpha/beta hydrolase [Anabaena sp. FACHB-1237]
MNIFGNLGNTLRKNSWPLFLSMLLPTFTISNCVMAAEQVNTSYLALKISIPISALESYAKSGIIDDKIAKYYQYIPPDKLQKLRQILLQRILISPSVAAQFLNSPQGEFFLQRLTRAITNKSHSSQAEITNLRQALIAACAEPEGLNLLNLLRKYPDSNINIDLAATWQISQQLQTIIDDTKKAIALIQQEAKKEAIQQSSVANIPHLSSLANTTITKAKKQTITFFDPQRHRQLVTDIYIPDLPHPAPVIIISHGLGLDSSNFRYLADHLASHGFAVIIPNHPPQNSSLSQYSQQQILASSEFKDRPLDIKYILDQLELNPPFHQHLNLQQVGILGQSFGGYTALALAGAKINFKQLKQDCHPQKLKNSWNMSLLFQCRALELSDHRNNNLRDPRIKAAIAINPISSSIFGKAGLNEIKTPIMIFSSSKDTVAPALSEQILPFSWINHAQKYLVILVGATHFSAIGNSNPQSKQLPLPPEMVGNAWETHHYIKTLSLPFFQGYVSEKPQYLAYLNSAYAQKIAHKSLELNLITSLNDINIKSSHNITYKKQNSPIPYIVKFGFWMLDIGISIIHVLTFSHR